MNPRPRPTISAAIVAVTLVAGVSACSSTSDTKDAPRSGVTVKVSNSSLGPILTDQKGQTLYAFTHDKDGASSCTDQCIATWPALTVHTAGTAGNGATAALLGKAQRAQGASQATYNGWPLYYYVADAAPGDVNGEGVDNVWFAVSAAGKLIRTAG
jgi:predicted lipoprotein with Yx(FWY)xxD motif